MSCLSYIVVVVLTLTHNTMQSVVAGMRTGPNNSGVEEIPLGSKTEAKTKTKYYTHSTTADTREAKRSRQKPKNKMKRKNKNKKQKQIAKRKKGKTDHTNKDTKRYKRE